METLQKNELFTLAMDLNLTDLTNLCKTSKKLNFRLCANEDFWKTKLGKDFPEWYLAKDTETIKNLGSFKNIYIFLHNLITQDAKGFFSKISEKSGEIIKRIRNIIDYDVSRHMEIKRRKVDISQQEDILYHLYDIVFDYILKGLQKIARLPDALYPGDVYKYVPFDLGQKIEKMLNIHINEDFWYRLTLELNTFISTTGLLKGMLFIHFNLKENE